MDLSTHDMDLPRGWPTDLASDEPIRYVWHACRTDLRDLLISRHWIKDLDRVKDPIVG